jgi:hypothetical protein
MFRQYLKRTSYYLLLAFVGLLVIYGIGRTIQVWSGSFYSGDRGPYLQLPSPTAMTLRWQSADAVQASVRYGTAPARLDQESRAAGKAEQHEVRLTGLQPDTRYYYAIYQDGRPVYRGPDYHFRTVPQTGNTRPIRFWVTGDQGYPGPGQQQVRDAALGWMQQHPRPELPTLDFWVTTGDNAYRSGTNQQFQDGFFQPYHAILRQVPVWPTYGNHDSRRWAFYDLFSLPGQGQSGGLASATEPYYSFDYADLHVLMLDTQGSDLDPDSPMLAWLKQDLAATRQPWKIAVFHHPPYTHGGHNSDNMFDSHGRMFDIRKNLLPILEQAGVQLVLSGHSHLYERSYPLQCHYGTSSSLRNEMIVNKQIAPGSVYRRPATVYVVIGSSSKLDSGPLDHPAMPVTYAGLGSVVIDIAGDRMIPRFLDQQGEVKDWFVIQRNLDATVPRLDCP